MVKASNRTARSRKKVLGISGHLTPSLLNPAWLPSRPGHWHALQRFAGCRLEVEPPLVVVVVRGFSVFLGDWVGDRHTPATRRLWPHYRNRAVDFQRDA